MTHNKEGDQVILPEEQMAIPVLVETSEYESELDSHKKTPQTMSKGDWRVGANLLLTSNSETIAVTKKALI